MNIYIIKIILHIFIFNCSKIPIKMATSFKKRDLRDKNYVLK